MCDHPFCEALCCSPGSYCEFEGLYAGRPSDLLRQLAAYRAWDSWARLDVPARPPFPDGREERVLVWHREPGLRSLQQVETLLHRAARKVLYLRHGTR
ncbi:MAG: hypothetical protein Kow001_10260 [Acidobacteriota bacterium]